MNAISKNHQVTLASNEWQKMSLNNAKNFGTQYTEQEKAALTALYEAAFTEVNQHEVVTGTVIKIGKCDVLISIGAKSDGVISLNEFRDMPGLQPGDTVEVYVEEQEDAKGRLVLSRKKAKLFKGWEKIQAAEANQIVLEGTVKRRTKGGLIVDIYGIEAFLPGSQIDIKPVRDFDAYVGKTIDVAVVKINYTNDNVVVSHKVLIEKSLESQKSAIISNLEKGQILEGTVKNMTSFGAFIDLGGVDGLLHITDMSWGRVNHPEETLEMGQKIKVVVTGFDENKKRISLGTKQLTPHPWDALPDSVEVGAIVKGKIVRVEDFGAFLEIMPGIEGLIHNSVMSWSQYLRDTKDLIKIGDEIEAVVLTLNKDEKKMSFGLKQLTGDPWEREDLLQQYAVGTKHKGIVRNITRFGAFIELEGGIDGLVYISDMSWTQKINHPSEILKKDDEVDTVVLEINTENRKIKLGLKQLEENPWDTYATMFELGSIHQGVVTKKIEKKGGIVELSHGIEGFVPKRHLIKQDDTEAEVGETLDFCVLEFSKENRKILLSHAGTHTAIKPMNKKRETKSSAHSQSNTSGNLVSEETSTLGDLAELANLKEQIESKNK